MHKENYRQPTKLSKNTPDEKLPCFLPLILAPSILHVSLAGIACAMMIVILYSFIHSECNRCNPNRNRIENAKTNALIQGDPS
jgi:hypothetical protein